MGTDRKDLFTYILGDELGHSDKSQEIPGDLVLDSELAIVAGSDSTATTLTAIVYLLACHPEKQKFLQQEVDQLFNNMDNLSHQELVGAPMLEGCINEALRQYPAIASGLPRMTPSQGAKIAGQWIPGNMLVTTPTYTTHRGQSLSQKVLPTYHGDRNKPVQTPATSRTRTHSSPNAGSPNPPSSSGRRRSTRSSPAASPARAGHWRGWKCGCCWRNCAERLTLPFPRRIIPTVARGYLRKRGRSSATI